VDGFSFGEWFEDARGREPLTWLVRPRDDPVPAFELRTVIREVGFCGRDPDGLEPQERVRTDAAGFARSPQTGGCATAGSAAICHARSTMAAPRVEASSRSI